MFYVWLSLLVVLNTVWLGLTFFALPGNWLIVISTSLFAWWQSDNNVFSIYTLIIITALAFTGEVIEFLAGAGGAKKAGASWLGSIGAIAGAITGAVIGTFIIPIPFLGTLIGACGGAGLGTLAVEMLAGRKLEVSFRFGLGAGLGQFIGITSKVVIGLVIWLFVVVAVFWP